MTIFLTIAFAFFLTNVLGQNTPIQKETFPKGLTASLDKVNHPGSFRGRECIATVTFSNSKKSVSYNLFNYTPLDSLDFEKMKLEHLKTENCGWNGKERLSKNSPVSFNKGDYFFLVGHCPCGAWKRRCGNLVKKIDRWRSG